MTPSPIENLAALVQRTSQLRNHRLRSFLLSLYNGKACDLSEIQSLDSDLRRMIAELITTVGHSVFDYQIRQQFSQIGKSELGWFMEPLEKAPERIEEHYRHDIHSLEKAV